MDEFAQTRGSDDLFDDDFTPISPPIDEPETSSPTPAVPQPRRPSQPQIEGSKTQAVRGDRSGTGGVKKPKLTEEELAARMTAVRLNAQKRSEAHKRAEADEASFQEREKVAAQKRQVDAQNRRVMDGEREKNRQRKLNAQAGRDWDAEKNQDEFNTTRGGRGQYRRGAHGGVRYDGGRTNGRAGDYEIESQVDDESNQKEPYHGRGRARGRGGGGERGRGHGEFNSSHVGRGVLRQNNSRNLEVGLESEFPTLPPGTKAIASSDDTGDDKKDLPKPIKTPQPPAMATGTWADQVESSETTTKEQPTS